MLDERARAVDDRKSARSIFGLKTSVLSPVGGASLTHKNKKAEAAITKHYVFSLKRKKCKALIKTVIVVSTVFENRLILISFRLRLSLKTFALIATKACTENTFSFMFTRFDSAKSEFPLVFECLCSMMSSSQR